MVDTCASSLSALWYITWNFEWSKVFIWEFEISETLGKIVGFIWFSMFHRDDSQGSKAPSYLLENVFQESFWLCLYGTPQCFWPTQMKQSMILTTDYLQQKEREKEITPLKKSLCNKMH